MPLTISSARLTHRRFVHAVVPDWNTPRTWFPCSFCTLSTLACHDASRLAPLHSMLAEACEAYRGTGLLRYSLQILSFHFNDKGASSPSDSLGLVHGILAFATQVLLSYLEYLLREFAGLPHLDCLSIHIILDKANTDKPIRVVSLPQNIWVG